MRLTINALMLSIVAVCSTVYAGEPKLNEAHKIGATGWSWTVHEERGLGITLSYYDQHSRSYDISECMFCSGEEDNCDGDGVVAISLPDKEPAVAVVCHKGAHSQRLQIFAPLRHAEEAVFSVTGDYWVDYKILDKGIYVVYDRKDKSDRVVKHESVWPVQ